MHTVRFKGHIAQQDNKTGVVLVYKGGELVSFRACDKRLSGKELRAEVNRFLMSLETGKQATEKQATGKQATGKGYLQ